ncbi:hypothetical protein MKW94_001838 [Papaver nudicaule]|uniref:Germin-like protein n=1 Tax=Papaver nudicaule TaxID=74823 RepID=A0AA41VKS7_PAPNU|nr:hypothetical protein [Papaver nudicaule]
MSQHDPSIYKTHKKTHLSYLRLYNKERQCLLKSVHRAATFFAIFALVVLLITISPCFSDPDMLQDFCVADLNAATSVNGFPCKPVSSSDFFFLSGWMEEADTDNIFGIGTSTGNVRTFPGLNTLGLSMSRIDFAPNGTIPLHTHPRSSETGFVIKGEVLVGFISTRSVFYSKVLKAGEMFIIPKGLVHFQKNVGMGKATTMTAFNSHLPGTVILSTVFVTTPTVPNGILAQNFQVDETVITSIKAKFGVL